VGLLIWLLVASTSGLPDHLGWQNEVGRAWCWWSGRPALIGDSLDWGQDYARLGDWISRRPRDERALVCVYGLGTGDPYGLTTPMAFPTSAPWEQAKYLAVSANILYGYESGTCLSVDRGHSSLTDGQRFKLSTLKPDDRVGRTILIYRTAAGLPAGPDEP